DVCPRQRLQTVDDVELHLAGNHQFVLEQEVVIAVNGAADGVLERDHSMRRALLHDGLEHFVEGLARHRLDVLSAVEKRRGLAVRAGLPLIRKPQERCSFVLTRRAAAAAARTAPPASIAPVDTVNSTASAHTGVRGMQPALFPPTMA